MITGIAHLAFTVADMQKTKAFYETLGLKHAFTLKSDDGTPIIEYFMVCPGQFVEFFYRKSDTEGGYKREGSYAHLCLQVDDAHKTYEELCAKGITFRIAPKQGKDLNIQFWADDPDGNPIEFMQMNPESPQSKA